MLLYLIKCQNRSGSYYPNRGGCSASSIDCGIFYVSIGNVYRSFSWSSGAAISY